MKIIKIILFIAFFPVIIFWYLLKFFGSAILGGVFGAWIYK